MGASFLLGSTADLEALFVLHNLAVFFGELNNRGMSWAVVNGLQELGKYAFVSLCLAFYLCRVNACPRFGQGRVRLCHYYLVVISISTPASDAIFLCFLLGKVSSSCQKAFLPEFMHLYSFNSTEIRHLHDVSQINYKSDEIPHTLHCPTVGDEIDLF